MAAIKKVPIERTADGDVLPSVETQRESTKYCPNPPTGMSSRELADVLSSLRVERRCLVVAGRVRKVSTELLHGLETGGVVLTSDFTYDPECIKFAPLCDLLPVARGYMNEIDGQVGQRTEQGPCCFCQQHHPFSPQPRTATALLLPAPPRSPP